MSLITLRFFIFLCITFILYYLIPKKYQWILLLSASLFFYYCASPYYLVFLLISSVSTYLCGLAIAGAGEKYRKTPVIITVVINIGILFAVKYLNAKDDYILPLGISFYTFMVVSYIVDVYRKKTEAEKNYIKYLLYVSYFPQIIEGPINRYTDMKSRLYEEHAFDLQRCKEAGYRILMGLFKKVVIAGRFGVYVDRVFANPEGYNGLSLFIAPVFYVIQLYADFAGCMDMVIGISELFGIEMAENFNLPLFSKKVEEFWQRWHITLGTWFKEYIYYSVFRSKFSNRLKEALKKTGLRKQATNIPAALALCCVWVFTGAWHGLTPNYIAWGVYYALIFSSALFLNKTMKKMRKKLPDQGNSKGYRIFETVRTLFIVTLGELIFRAESLKDIWIIIRKIFTDFSLSISSVQNAILPFTEDNTAVSYGSVAMVSFAVLFAAELLRYNEKDVISRHKYFNAAILIIVTLLFGVFGESGFMYMAY